MRQALSVRACPTKMPPTWRDGVRPRLNLTMAWRAQRIKKAGMGVLAANCAMIAKRAWQELGGFDERYQAGGEDTALAKSMLENGYEVVRIPPWRFITLTDWV